MNERQLKEHKAKLGHAMFLTAAVQEIQDDIDALKEAMSAQTAALCKFVESLPCHVYVQTFRIRDAVIQELERHRDRRQAELDAMRWPAEEKEST